MKRQNHRMDRNGDTQWPQEDIEYKVRLRQKKNDHSEIGKHIVSLARAKVGLASEHYHRAVADMAYTLWEKRGRPEGSDSTDWFNAEAALKPLWAADLSFPSGELETNNHGKL